MILVAGLRYAPSLLYVVFLGVIHRSYVVTVYQRTTYCEYCRCMGQYRTAHIIIVYHRVQTTGYAPVLTYRHLFLYATWYMR